jgi:hypothetical protein
MNTRGPLPLIAAAIGSALISLSLGCSKSADSTTVVESTRADGSVATITVSDSTVTVASSDAWDRIKDFAFDRRADFSAGLDRMSRDMDDKTAAFRANVSGVPDTVSSVRSKAITEYDEARADLKVRRANLDSATADTWADAKSKAAESWKSTKAAYDRVTKANPAS